MYLNPRDQEIVDCIALEIRVSVLAAAYVSYVQSAPNNKKQITHREFHREFSDGWVAFHRLETEG